MPSSRTVGLLILCLSIGGPTAAAPGAETYGSGIGEGKVLSPLELLSDPEQYVGETVRVEGRVGDVCPRRGCWIDIVGGADDRMIRFKVQDDVIVFPVSAKGRQVVAEGVFVKEELSREEAIAYRKHLADERGEPFDPDSVVRGETIYRIDGSGALIRR